MYETSETQAVDIVTLTSQIVASHVSKTKVATEDLPTLIDTVYAKLVTLRDPQTATGTQLPAIPISESITPDFLICLEDGKKFKMLKKHLMSCYGLTPEDYRAKWDLAPDYPMVAPNYAALRQELAKQTGLGKARA